MRNSLPIFARAANSRTGECSRAQLAQPPPTSHPTSCQTSGKSADVQADTDPLLLVVLDQPHELALLPHIARQLHVIPVLLHLPLWHLLSVLDPVADTQRTSQLAVDEQPSIFASSSYRRRRQNQQQRHMQPAISGSLSMAATGNTALAGSHDSTGDSLHIAPVVRHRLEIALRVLHRDLH